MMQNKRLVKALVNLLGNDRVARRPSDCIAYEFDASRHRAKPDVVVFPTSVAEVVAVVRLCGKEGVPYVARGAGTNLVGSSIALRGGVVMCMVRMNRILEIDPGNR